MVRTHVQWFPIIIMKSDNGLNNMNRLFSIAFYEIIRDDCTPFLIKDVDEAKYYVDFVCHIVTATKKCTSDRLVLLFNLPFLLPFLILFFPLQLV